MRVVTSTVLAVLAAASPAAAAWTPVLGVIRDMPSTAVADGHGALLANGAGRFVAVTTIRDNRVLGRQVISRGVGLSDVTLVRRRDGSAVLVWEQGGRPNASIRRSRSARFGPRRAIPGYSGAAQEPAVAAGPDGTVVAAWWGGPDGGRLGIQAAQLLPDGSWSPAVDVTAGTYPQQPFVNAPVDLSITASRDGRFAVLWRQPDSGTQQTALVTAVRDAVGVWGTPTVLGTGDVTGLPGDLAVALPAGAGPVAAWSQAGSRGAGGEVTSDCLIAAALRSAGPAVRSTLGCATRRFNQRVRVVAAPDGSVHVAWAQATLTPYASSVWTARWDPRAGTWGTVVRRIPSHVGANWIEGLGTTSKGRVLLLTELAQGRSGNRSGRVTALVFSADGSLITRVVRPGPRRYLDQRLFLLSGRPEALLVSPTKNTLPDARAQFLTLP